MKPIYKPKGKAAEYGEYALNIYTGCGNRCYYCFAPTILRKDRELFHTDVRPRENIVEETRKQLEREKITDKLIHLCFTCDPYPVNYDSSTTREIIKLLKEYGNHVQILTKGDGRRDFDLLDENDWYCVTIDCSDDSPLPAANYCLAQLKQAHDLGIKTWVSYEPVLDAEACKLFIMLGTLCVDKVKIGKLNYYPSDIDWKKFGNEVEKLCQDLGVDYYIKESLRKEMEG